MAKRVQAPKRAPRDPWVPAGLRGGDADKTGRNSADTEEWLPVTKPGVNGRNGHSAVDGGGNGAGAAKPDPAAEPSHSRRHRRRHRLPKRATARERWLILRLRRSKRRVEEMREQIDQLNQRISELEASPEPRAEADASPAPAPKPKRTARAAAANGAKSSTARSAKRSRTAKAAPTRRRKPATNGNGAARKGGAKLDLNNATFDQLRGLGLSVTQTSRLISYRESDGFTSVDDLEQIPGLAQGTVAKLRSQVRVAGR
jgi:DNA uptake protein ComE-like DNA-binding protein